MRTLIMLSLLAFNPITMGVVGGVQWRNDFNASLAKAYADRNFRGECPRYKEASTWERWTDVRVSNLRWCKPYLDRI
ncbi:hypothetical protein CN198_14345 [Sinorhizobium meliloti]|uniref:hypothetical protein n=1 Tax=Rhizobium meliloti TaxID=382 RepID=UPI000FD87912|nr:hypothetical protein [Sinorhizobium meliloti]RVH69235.1 hypothetical protein CN198_14345 [Sinorhizobium meliloti]